MKREQDIGVRVVRLSIALNIVLLILKGVVGLLTNSAALQADAVNSAGDTISSLAILFGIKYAMRPRDDQHHYGYGKMEALTSLFVGIVILLSTFYLWYSIINTLATRNFNEASFWALGAALVAIGVKIFLYIRTMTVGKKTNSIAVITNAKDHRNDIIATAGTVIAIMFALVGDRAEISAFKYSESIAAAITSIFILRAGIEIISASAKILMDAAPDQKIIDSMVGTVMMCEGVQDIDWFRCRTTGRGILVDVAVEVDPELSIAEGQNIDSNIIKAIQKEFKTVLDVQVQINPDEDDL